MPISLRKTACCLRSMIGGLLLLLTPAISAQRVYTVAGGYVGDGGPATSASLARPWFAAYDPQGNLLISDFFNCRIRRVDTQGKISTVAGTGICGFNGDGGPAIRARILHPLGIAIDTVGNTFFVDGNRIRKIDVSGTITSIAGHGKYGYCGDGGPPLKACFAGPTALALGNGGADEVVYVADTSNNRIRRITLGSKSKITTFAGNGTWGYSGDGGPAKKASFAYPDGVVFSNSSHALWISDSNNSVIRKVDTKTGIITTFFGTGSCDFDSQSVCVPYQISLDASGNLHVADLLGVVLRISVSDRTGTLEAGIEFGQGFNGDGRPATSTLLNNSSDALLDPFGNLTILDLGNDRVRQGSGTENVTTLAGGYIGDGHQATRASLNDARNLAFDQGGSLYIVDSSNHRIRKVSRNGVISTIAGTGMSGYSGDGGPATKAMLRFPLSVVADQRGNVYIGDGRGGIIRRVDTRGVISTFQDFGGRFDSLSTDSVGNIYAADEQACVIWKFTPDGTKSIVAGIEGQCAYNGDGIPAIQASLQNPFGVTLDSNGNLYIGDMYNHRIRKVDQNGVISTIAGNGTCGFSGDGGPGASAMLCYPQGVAVDAKGNVYVADTQNYRMRVVNSSGIIQTLAGTGKTGYNGNSLPTLKTNLFPWSVAASPDGFVYVLDWGSVRVRKIQ